MLFPISFESRKQELPRIAPHNELIKVLDQINGLDFVDAMLSSKIDMNTILIFEEYEEPHQGNDGSPEFHYHFNTAMNIALTKKDAVAIDGLLKNGASAARYVHFPDGSTGSWSFNRVGYRMPSEEWHILNLCDDTLLRAKNMPDKIATLAKKAAVDEIETVRRNPSEKSEWLKISALFYFILKGDKAAVQTLLESGVSPDSFGPGGMSAIGLSIRKQNLEILNMLKMSGARLDGPCAWKLPRIDEYYYCAYSDTQINPLVWASAWGFLDGVKFLQKFEAYANDAVNLTSAINFTMWQLRSNADGLIRKLPVGVKETLLFLGTHLITSSRSVDPPLRDDAAQALLKIVIEISGKRWKEAEDFFKNDPWSATNYAVEVIGGRWEPGEQAIAGNAICAYHYAMYVIRGRWPAGEKAILRDPPQALVYARDVLTTRWSEAESLFLKNPSLAVSYAESVIKGTWPEAESVIKTDAQAAARYAQNVIKSRWLEAEDVILKDSYAAELYKVHVHHITPKSVCCIKPWEPLKNCPKGPTGCDHYKRMHASRR